MPASPACPGIIRECDLSALSRIPPGSDALGTFAKLRADSTQSDEEAFLKLIATYNDPLWMLSHISACAIARVT